MIKSLLFGLNILAILLLGSFQKTNLEITQDLPANLKPGEEAVVTVKIDKSDVSGFAKFQLSLAPGLVVEPIDNAGASFTFNDNKAKFIWMALPADKRFTLKYRIIAEQEAVGNLAVNGRFSYIYENERKNYDLSEKIIAVGDPSAIAAERIKQSMEEKASNTEATVRTNRTVTSVGINQWKVNVDIEKSNLQGFAKIEETIPDGYTVINIKASSAVFSLDDKKIKYIWYDIPENENVVVTYKMLPVIAMDGFTPTITGDFSYLKDEETVHVPIEGGIAPEDEMPEALLAENADTAAAEVISNSDTIADEIAENSDTTTTTDEMPAETDEEIAVDTPAIATEEIAKNQKPEQEQEPETTSEQVEKPVEKEPADETISADNGSQQSRTDANIVDVPEPQTGIFYRVQIAAGKNNLKQPVFAKIYRFDEKFNIENQHGLFKYTTGHFQIYKAARDGRERITAQYEKFQGPFVTAYNSGERITVQEALMITNQKWYQ